MPTPKALGISVESGVGFSAISGKATPLVQITVNDAAGHTLSGQVTPRQARRIGLDMIGAAGASLAETAIREYARAKGIDADPIILALKRRTLQMLDDEKP